MPEPIKVLFGVLSTYERSGWHHPSITQFFADSPFINNCAYRMIPVHNWTPAAAGRNVFCKQNKDTETDWLCMIDNDMHIPLNLLDAVKNAPPDADIVCPQFYMWDQGQLKLVLCWGVNENEANNGVRHFAPGYYPLIKCGTGVIFIKPQVFNKVPYPYFKYRYDDDGMQYGSEDIWFMEKAVEAGCKIYGTTEVKIGHYKSVELGSLWDWYRKTLDNSSTRGVHDSQDSGRSSDQNATDSVPAIAE